MGTVLEVTVGETENGKFLFSNVFFERGEGLFVGRWAANVDKTLVPPLSEFTEVDAIPYSTFQKYEEALFGTAFDTVPVNTFWRRPRLLPYFADNSTIAGLFSEKARVYLGIDRAPHPNIVSRIGSLVREGRVVGVILPRYEFSLLDAFEKRRGVNREKIIHELRAALDHLHGLGYAHNDVHLGNIMLNARGSAVLIDYEFTRQTGVYIQNTRKQSLVKNDESGMKQVERALRAMERNKQKTETDN